MFFSGTPSAKTWPTSWYKTWSPVRKFASSAGTWWRRYLSTSTGLLSNWQKGLWSMSCITNPQSHPISLSTCITGLATNSILFCFLFCGGQINDPSSGITFLFRSSQQLPRLPLGPSKGFLSWHGALLRPSTRLVRCFRNYRDTRTPSSVPR